MEAVQDTKYLGLGVTFTSKLKWDTHIASISGAANKLLRFLKRSLKKCPKALKEKAYKAYVRPKLEYASSVWDPHHQKSIEKLEMVQRRAARFVSNIPHRHTQQQTSISKVVLDLGWQPLQVRRKNNRLIMMYRIIKNHVEIPQIHHPTLREFQPVRGNQHNFTPMQPEVEAFKYSFFPRTITDWNQLSKATVASKSLDAFKKNLF